MNYTRRIRKAVLALGSFTLVVSGALAMSGPAQKEVNTAAEHAKFAASATSLKATHMHLHHAINCMVGSDGEGYNAGFGDPCKGQGRGAINDVDSRTTKAMIEQALSLAKVGVQVENEAAAKDTAKAVQELLAAAGENKSM